MHSTSRCVAADMRAPHWDRNLTFSVCEPFFCVCACMCVCEARGLPADRILLRQMSHFQKGFTPHWENEVKTFLRSSSLSSILSCLLHLVPPSLCSSSSSFVFTFHLSVSILFSAPLNYLYLAHTRTHTHIHLGLQSSAFCWIKSSLTGWFKRIISPHLGRGGDDNERKRRKIGEKGVILENRWGVRQKKGKSENEWERVMWGAGGQIELKDSAEHVVNIAGLGFFFFLAATRSLLYTSRVDARYSLHHVLTPSIFNCALREGIKKKKNLLI